MLRKIILLGLMTALLLPALAFAQARPTNEELGAFPETRARIINDHQDLRKYARITTTSYTFLNLIPNARSAALGDAYTAVGNDLGALLTNPAGITQIERYEASVSYMKWLVRSNMGTFALAAKTGLATFAFNFAYFSTEEFEETTSSSPTGTGRMIRGGDMAVGVTIAKQMTDKLSVGGTIRWIREDLDLISYSSIDLDFGSLFYTGYRSTRLGVSLRNLGNEAQVVGKKARLPVAFNLSGAAEVYGNLGDPVSVTLAVEQVFYTDLENRYHFGGEIWLQNTIALRAGYKPNYDNESWSVGLGLKQKIREETVKLDVSYSKAEELEENPVRVSIGIGF